MTLKNFYQLLDQGKHEEAFREVETLQNEQRLEAELVKNAYFLVIFGQGGEQVTALVEQILSTSHPSVRLEAITRTIKSYVLMWQAQYDEGWKEIELAQELFTTLSEDEQNKSSYIQAFLLHMEGGYYFIQEKNELALDAYTKAIRLIDEEGVPMKMLIPVSYNDIAVIYMRQGKWEQASKYNEMCLSLGIELGNETLQVYPLNRLCNILCAQGDLTRALEYAHKALELAQKVKDQRAHASVLETLGVIYQGKGDLFGAEEHYKTSLTIRQEIQIMGLTDLSSILYKLCLLSLDMKKVDQAQYYLQQLQEHYKEEKSFSTKTYCMLAEALILKRSKRFREKAQAQESLKNIVDNTKTNERYRFVALLHYCDLLLQETKLFGDENLFENALVIVKQIAEIAQEWGFIPDIINALLLQVKFHIVEGEVEKAFQYLDQAQRTAEKQDLRLLVEQIQEEQKQLEREHVKWQELIQRNASIQERLEQAQLEEYISEAIKLRKLMPSKG